MNRFRALGTVRINAGTVVGLSDAQYARRAHCTRPRADVGPDAYEATGPFDLKAGEEFGAVGLNKAALAIVKPLPAPRARKAG